MPTEPAPAPRVGAVSAAVRILWDVVSYRLARLEMANLGGAVSVMLALRLSFADIAVRTGFAFLMNLLAYLTNDYCDIERDLASGRATAKTEFLAANRGAALGAQGVLVLVLAGIALWWSPGLLVALAAGAGLCWLYSAKLKRVAYVDVVLMGLCGAGMALVAVPLDRVLGWVLVTQLGLFSACFELIQVLRDREEDERNGVFTTAVRLGEARTLAFLRLLMIVSALFASLELNRFVGPILIFAVLVPFDSAHADKYWNRVRLVFGLGWLGIVSWVIFTGHSNGLYHSL
jgi:4-hydroxybenzoate polyprenyltransferase